MPMILGIIVAVAWMVILGPSLMKRRSRAVGEIGSISHFHQQLRVLENSAPQPIVAPAYRLRTVDGNGDPETGPGNPGIGTAPTLTVVGADKLPRPALAFLGQDPDQGAGDQPAPPRASPGRTEVDPMGDPGSGGWDDDVADPCGTSARSADPWARHLVRRRRRDTLAVLACVFVATMVIGFVPGAGAAWIVTATSGVALVAYVVLLVRLKRTAEEREQKLRYLVHGGDSLAAEALARGRVVMRGRSAHPSNQAVAAR